MELIFFSSVLFIAGSVMSLRNNKEKSLAVVGIFVLIISIIMFWIIASWFALIPTIFGGCIIFANLVKGFSDSSDRDTKIESQSSSSGSKGIETRLYVNGKLESVINSPVVSKQSQADNDIRIMQDCLEYINNSKNIETVINRYNDLIMCLERMASYETAPNIKHQKEMPSQALIRMREDEVKIINNAITRAYTEELSKASQLKTEKGRINRIERFFSNIEPLATTFPAESRGYIEILESGYKADLSMKI